MWEASKTDFCMTEELTVGSYPVACLLECVPDLAVVCTLDGGIIVAHRPLGRGRQTSKTLDARVENIAFWRQYEAFVVLCIDRSLRLVSSVSLAPLASIGHSFDRIAWFLSDEMFLLSTHRDGRICRWEVKHVEESLVQSRHSSWSRVRKSLKMAILLRHDCAPFLSSCGRWCSLLQGGSIAVLSAKTAQVVQTLAFRNLHPLCICSFFQTSQPLHVLVCQNHLQVGLPRDLPI